jgi:hypothetical protein
MQIHGGEEREILFGKPDERNSYLWDLGRNGRLKLR